jgi:hypothetical protein
MTHAIELLERAHQEDAAAFPPAINDALTLIEEVETRLPDVDIHRSSDPEAAMAAHRAISGNIGLVRGALAERFPNDPSRAERFLSRATHIVDGLLDETLIVADEDVINARYDELEAMAASGNRFARRVLNEVPEDSGQTGALYTITSAEAAAISDVPELIIEDIARDETDAGAVDRYRYTKVDKEALDRTKENPVAMDLTEAEVVLAAPLQELRDALRRDDRATVIQLSAAVLLIIDHVDIEGLTDPSVLSAQK